MTKHPSSKLHQETLHSMISCSMTEPNCARERTDFTAGTIAFPSDSNCGLTRQMGDVRANRSNWLSQVFMRGLGDIRLCTPSVAPHPVQSAYHQHRRG